MARHALRLALAALLALTVVGCAGTQSRDQETTPPPAAPEPQAEPQEEPAEPEAEPATPAQEAGQVGIRFEYPNGWTPRLDRERNQIVLTHDESGSTISFTIFPSELMSVRDFATMAWEQAILGAEGNDSVDVSTLVNDSRDGRDFSFFIVNETLPEGMRITRLFAVFQSNSSQHNVMMLGEWPSALDSEMFEAFQAVGERIRINEPQAVLEPPVGDWNVRRARLMEISLPWSNDDSFME